MFDKHTGTEWDPIDITNHRCVIPMREWLQSLGWAPPTQLDTEARWAMIERQSPTLPLLADPICDGILDNGAGFDWATRRTCILCKSPNDTRPNARNAIVGSSLDTKPKRGPCREPLNIMRPQSSHYSTFEYNNYNKASMSPTWI